MTTLTYKGYVAEVTVDVDAGVLHGEVVNASAVLTFSSKTVGGLMPAFEDTIADYVDWCAERGVEPGKPYSGAMTLRMDPAIHRAAAERAATHRVSLNQWIVRTVECELGQRPASVTHDDLQRRVAIGVRDEVIRVMSSRTIVSGETIPDVWSTASTAPVVRVIQ